MARAGILYSHVAHAASRLTEAGTNPTVDNVRAALGSTGSKSTIAPLLKRWKAEHQQAVAQAEVGLPASLLDAMKCVYQDLQAELGRELEQARTAHESALRAATEQMRHELALRQALAVEHAALGQAMEQVESALKTSQ